MNAPKLTLAALLLSAFAVSVNAQETEMRTLALTADDSGAYAVEPEVRVIGPSRPAPRLGFDGRMTYDGLRVERVHFGTDAYDIGLERGDVIHEVNGRHIDSMVDYQEALLDAVDFNNGRVRLRIENVRWHTGESSQRWVTRTIRLAVPCHSDGGSMGGVFGG